jgi:hypothetical protein
VHKGPLSVFTDGKGNRRDCAWKCISECKSSELNSVVNPPETVIFEHKGNFHTVEVHSWEVIFTGEYDGDEEEFLIRDSPESNSVILIYPSGNGSFNRTRETKKLCKWLKKLTEQGASINISAQLTISEKSRLPHKSHLVKFSSPWIRPLKDWKVKWNKRGLSPFLAFISLSIDLESTSKPDEVEEQEHPIPISEILPVGLAKVRRPVERSHHLSYYGVAHPAIHRISRKHRQASQHRPRHFHSPVR